MKLHHGDSGSEVSWTCTGRAGCFSASYASQNGSDGDGDAFALSISLVEKVEAVVALHAVHKIAVEEIPCFRSCPKKTLQTPCYLG